MHGETYRTPRHYNYLKHHAPQRITPGTLESKVHMGIGGWVGIVAGGIGIIVMLIILLCRLGAWSVCDGLGRRHVI